MYKAFGKLPSEIDKQDPFILFEMMENLTAEVDNSFDYGL